MLAGRLMVAVILLTLLSTSHQEDLPLHKNIIKHDKLSIQEYGNKTRTRKFTHENSTLQEDTVRNITSRINAITNDKNRDPEAFKAESAGDGTGVVKTKKDSKEDDEDDKTLSQQVADGKYGLIHTELFQVPPKRPGILTYKHNPEVPKDNENNLGGLEAEEIWLAENHLLVLAGGGFSKKNRGDSWPPIDGYVAPRRQVKIPPNPKVPPPFPIQLSENGPIEIIKGPNGSFPRPLPFFHPSAADINVTGMFPFFPPPPPNFPPGLNPGNFTPGNGPPFPFPFSLPNGSIPQLPPFPPGFQGPPPGLPFPPPNWTALIDEDDPSIYYPPPYDFYFPKDNTSHVPAGPLVPGIVLPPPPDFFAPFDNTTLKPSKVKPPKDPALKKVKYQPPKQYFDIPTKLPDIDNSLNSLSTPTNFYKTTEEPKVTKPSVQIIKDFSPVDEITNEVSPGLKNKDDWVPIPAPQPYYITGPEKPFKENVLVVMNTPKQVDTDGYQYNIPTKAFDTPEIKPKYKKPKQDFYNQNHINDDNHVYADEQLVKEYRPVVRKSKTKTKSTVSPAQVYHNPVRTGGKSLQATYYFYEDPISEEDAGYKPPPKQLRQSNKQSSVSTEASLVNYYVPKQPIHIKPKPNTIYKLNAPKLQISDENLYRFEESTSTTLKPSLLDYFLYNGDKNGGYNFVAPETQSIKSTSRPIFEYSYTAPGYKDQRNTKAMDFYYNSYPTTVTTSRPTDYLYPYENSISTTPATRLTLSMLKTPAPPVPLHLLKELFVGGPPKAVTTPAPPVSSTVKPKPQIIRGSDKQTYHSTSTTTPWRDVPTTRKPFSYSPYTTQNPFYAFFTHHDESLVDDITKKYFTMFGQKIKRPNQFESTTPLSIVHASKEQHNLVDYKFNDFDQSKEHQYDSNYSDEEDSKRKPKLNKNKLQNDIRINLNHNSHENGVYNENHNYNSGYGNSEEQFTAYKTKYPSSQENVNIYHDTQENYNDYNSQQNHYKFSQSSEDPNYGLNYNLNSNRYNTPRTTTRPKVETGSYQTTAKIPPQIISVSNGYKVGSSKKKKPPIVTYDYDYDYEKYPAPSLTDDTQVNFKKPYQQDYDSEWVPLSGPYQDTRDNSNQFISYKLPGNGNGHFFFLTPQAIGLQELEKYFFPLHGEAQNNDNLFKKRNIIRTRRKPDETSTSSVKEQL